MKLSTTMRRARGDWNSGVMSRNTTPGLGKSGTGRISDLMANSSKIIAFSFGTCSSAREPGQGRREGGIRGGGGSVRQVAAGQGAQLDGVEDLHFLALGVDQAVLLEAGEHPRHGLHGQAQVVAEL